ncbi:MAG TPA: glucose-1-phosphate cytidylyltransferase [Rhizomicrobium sp.]|nr:glucose-1-phosphate cytidylyltransferase [Rhizomicrobium sp.]HWC64045.1 glucose-1-phosphate cytidylyltransferase [Rhizomicrobium sp.]
MKAVILAGGRGSRIAEETHLRPKPMIEIGGKPILWHIMKIYAAHGVTEFLVCLGYQGYVIKEYFANYLLHNSDVTFDLAEGRLSFAGTPRDPWRVTLVDTGLATETGGRVKRLARYLKGEDAFCLTYGDGLGNVDITRLIAAHRTHGKPATMTVVHPPGRFGVVHIEGDKATQFHEKPNVEHGYINGGFFVLHPEVLELIEGDATVWEREPLESLARGGNLNVYRHDGFWQPMDTLREKDQLEQAWASGKAPWKIWD